MSQSFPASRSCRALSLGRRARVSTAAFALVALASPLAAQPARAPTGRVANGFSAERLARVDRFLQQYVDSNRVGGAVALVLRDGQVAYQKSVGWIDRESRRPMTADAMFRIASQSKAITSTAILMLIEEGKVALADPVSRFIPAYARTTVASRADSGRTILPARRQITIQDLLTHTAGISYGGERWIAEQYEAKGLGRAAGNGWYTADKTEPVCETMERLATLPFIAQPGEAYVYGYNTDILGCVVERASGLSLDDFIRTRITGPLGMRDTYFFVPARRQITIQDLLTHTAGISYGGERWVAEQYEGKGLGRAAGNGWYTADKTEPVCETMERLATLPFVAQPGEAYVYGYNTDILGCVVERASGLSLDEFIRTRITGPLGMTDTYFFVPTSKTSRLVTLYMNDSTGRIARAPEGSRGQGHYVEGPRRSFSGGAGLVSTARDYARFLQMMLNRGEIDGVRILSPRSVDLMTSNQAGTLFSQSGRGFGLGFEVVERLGADGYYSVGSFGWGGAYGSDYMVDPVERLVVVFMMNQMPNRSDVASKFPTLVYQALTDLAPRVGWPARPASR